MNSLVVVVLNWNGGSQLIECVKSVTASSGVDPFILIVDNGSTDGSDRSVVAAMGHGTILKQPRNVGVARGFNIGVDWALQKGASNLLLLNSDARVTPECVRELMSVLERNPDVAVVSPRILDARNQGRIWFDGGFYNTFGYPVHRRFGREPNGEVDECEQDFATGCVFLARCAAFKAAGSFDEIFYAYSEDVDFCSRARQSGWRIVHVPRAVAVHDPSSSVIRNAGKWFRDYYITRNNLLLYERRHAGLSWIWFLSYFITANVLIPTLYFSLTGQLRRIGAVFAGGCDYLKRRFGERDWRHA